MSTSYLSFATITKLYSNNIGVVSAIGELSGKALSYAKDPGKFSLAVSVPSATTLVNFLSIKDGVEFEMPQAIADVQIGISNWLYAQALAGNVTSSRPNCLQILKTQFTTNIVIEDIGEMATNNAVWLPSYVKGYHIVGAEQQPFYMWMADAYFRLQYPYVKFTVIHPLPLKEMDWLMNANYQEIAKRLALETPVVVAKRESLATNSYEWPGTERNPIEFQIMDLINLGKFNVGTWVIWHWGNGADAEDQLYDQIQKEILKDSAYGRDKWEEKIPDLFNPLEFYVIPEFGRIGVVNRTDGSSTYSPIVDRETMMDIATTYLGPTMPADHLIKSAQAVPLMYKSLQALFVGKVNNRQGMKKISAVIPDYQLISSKEPEFDTMSQESMDFAFGMDELMAGAEVVTDISLLPPGIQRVERLGKLCVTKRIGRVKYVAFTKFQMIKDGIVVED
jgi:hypothetical protein